jgi:predicted phosphodiesterase
MIALIADIHGDLDRLQGVIEAAKERGISRFWCLGDIIGTGGSSVECWRLVQRICEQVIAGNHDMAAAGNCEITRFIDEQQIQAINEAQNYLIGDEQFTQLRPEQVAYMYDYPVRLVHGMPGDPAFGWLAGAGEAYFAFQRCDEPLILCGHTHRPAWCRGADFQRAAAGDEVSMSPGQIIVNPGAVAFGQWAILHLAHGVPQRVEFCSL